MCAAICNPKSDLLAPFDEETIPFSEPVGLFGYLNIYNLISLSMQLK